MPASTLPSFFDEFAVPWGKLVVARFVVFALLAADAILQLPHAPRYGAGFNVAHVPGLDAVAPGRVGFVVAQVALTVCFAAVAVGVGSRLLVLAGAVLYGWVYFSSQLDSYQHHYLVWLVLVVGVAIPWFPPQSSPLLGPRTPVRSWALRLLLLQLAIMYGWAAISKLDGSWLDGTTIARQIGPGLARDGLEAIGIARGAKLVVWIEFALAATIAFPRLWPIAFPLGVGLHVGILLSHLEIGLFAALMLAFYVLVVPARLTDWLLRLAPQRTSAAVSPPPARHASLVRSAIIALVGTAAAVAAQAALPIPGVMLGVGIGTALLVATAGPVRARRLLTVGVVVAVLFAVARWQDVAVDYYRFWGGSARRLGDTSVAIRAYQRLTEVAPHVANGHYQLGRLLVADTPARDVARGEAALRRAAALDPSDARAPLALARQLANSGSFDDAQRELDEARRRDPAHRELAEVEAIIRRSAAP